MTDPAAADFTAPLSFGQQRLWLLDQLLPDKSVYNEPRVDRLTGPLDVAALARAFAAVVDRHEALRTRFVVVDGEPRQRIVAAQPMPLPVEDLSRLPVEAREPAARAAARAEARTAFALAEGPLLRARLLRLAPDEHWLVTNVHHIISDRWSSANLARELSVLYGAFVRGESSPLPGLPVQYADFAVWQRERLQGPLLDRHLAFWRDALAGLAPLELPTDRPRPRVADHAGGQLQFAVDATVTQALKDLARRENVTLFMLLLAAFQVLLHRLCGQTDIPIGVSTAGRSRPELESLIGFFVSTIVLRGDLSGDPDFRTCLARVRATALAAYAHQELPFEKLVEDLAPARDLARNPLYQVAFALQNSPVAEWSLPGVSVARVDGIGTGTSKFDLTFALAEAGGAMRGRVDYATALFDADTIERMSGHFRTLLGSIVADPDLPVSALGLQTAAERHRLLVDWNPAAVVDAEALPVHLLFAAQAARTPGAVALAPATPAGGDALTYASLDAKANQVAHHLRALGVGPEILVGVAMERSPDLIVALLGIMKAGGAYVPIDPAYPADRIAFMLADTRAPVLLTQARLARDMPAHAGRTVCLDADWPAIAASPSGEPPATASACNLAYVIYTSGSTGKPKGVMVEHRSLTNYMRWALDAYYRGHRGGSPLVHTIAFDGVITTLFGPLLCGQPLYLLPPYGEIDALAAGPPAAGPYALTKLTPSHLKLVNAALEASGAACPTATLMLGGEALVPKDVAWWQERFPEVRLVNHYGPTEATVGCCTFEIAAPVAGRAGIPIGRPNRNARLYVLDARLEPVPVGIVGELYIAGEGVARGYLNRPELTAERFVTDPFGPTGARMYRAGDGARWRADGVIELLGRTDLQVKIRGYRVELGEIEAALARHPDVGEALVALPAGDDDGRARRLVAYIVPRADARPAAAALRQFLKATLPEYMVPVAYVVLDALPLTPNGKVDRARLPAPADDAAGAASTAEATGSGLERETAALWAELLGVAHVDIRADFFDLGGHSLLAMQLLARIESRMGAAVTLREFFADPTPAGLAARLEVALAARAAAADPQRPSPPPQIRRNARVAVRRRDDRDAG